MDPTRVLTWDSCPSGLPEMMTVVQYDANRKKKCCVQTTWTWTLAVCKTIVQQFYPTLWSNTCIFKIKSPKLY